MNQISKTLHLKVEGNSSAEKSFSTSSLFRGFASIDQEMEREIAMGWFKRSDRTTSILKIGSYKMRG